jgi:hypothetical protein
MLDLPGLRGVLLLLFAVGLSAEGASAQECPNGRISYIFIDNRSIFDTADLDPDAPFAWAYHLANSLHIRTRENFIRKELLFETGDCLDSIRLSESERLLRSYRFIAKSDVFALPQPDGTQHVVVDTQDEWSTRVDLGFEIDEGPRFTGVELAELNLLGLGITTRFFFREKREQRDIGGEIETPRLFGSRLDGRVSGGKTRTGRFFEEGLFYPFVGEIGRVGARQSYVWRETLFSYVLPDDPEHSHLLVPFLDDRWDLVVGGRLGEPGNLNVFGGGVSRESVQFRNFPADLELVRNRDYASTDPADPEHVEAVRPQANSRTAYRVNFFLGQRNLRFVRRRGLDAMRGVQDVQAGTEVFVGLGRTLGGVQGHGGERLPDDLHTQISLFAGGVWDEWTVNTQLNVEARQVDGDRDRLKRWDDIFAEADAYVYWQPAGSGGHTVLFRISGAGGWSVQTPYQLTLGGMQAVRGYSEEAFPGGRRVVMSLEDRIYLPWPAPELIDFGLSFFVDMGHIQPGDVPFGVDSGWRTAIGAGIRFGLPPGTGNMARIDLAAPVGPRAQLKDVVLRISLQEVLGLLSGFRDDQLGRSLRTGVRPTVITLPW